MCATYLYNRVMDFLDPRKRRWERVRLMIGYGLMAVAIGLGTLILVYAAYGYGINTKTGDIVQNGLLFVDSKPSGADIYLNNKSINSTTSARLVLQAGNYDLKLAKSGYRDWQRVVALDEHAIVNYVYPFLFPKKPVTADIKTYASQPALITASPDRHWLLVQTVDTNLKTVTFDEYDTGTLAKAGAAQPIVTVSIPAAVIPGYGPDSTLKEVEWSTDNNRLLLEHTGASGVEFIVFDRSDPAGSFNVNQTCGANPTQVALRDKKVNQLYVYNQSSESLQLCDTDKPELAPPIINHVLAFKPYGSDTVMYVTASGQPAGKVSAHIWQAGKNYSLSNFAAGSKYLIDTAQFQGHSYFVAGSDASDRVNIYKDPVDKIRDPSIGKAIPLLALHDMGATDAKFSTNTRFISLQSGQNFAVYDLETKDIFNYSVKIPLTGSLHWMDGHRLMGASGGSMFVMDYDSTNQQILAASTLPEAGFFNRDYTQLVVTAPAAGGASVTLQRVDMRAGADLPKN